MVGWVRGSCRDMGLAGVWVLQRYGACRRMGIVGLRVTVK